MEFYKSCCWSIIAVFFLTSLSGQTLAALEADLVSKLPGQPLVSFRQYAGYVTINETTGSALFYYFVEAATNSSSKPLALWLNGGPGCSSIGGGAFTELGPFFPNGTGYGLKLNRYSWNKVANLLFVESPIGVGFSYSNTSSEYNSYNDDKTARDSVQFLLNWFKKFPEYKNHDLYLTGESYAGHYIPQLAIALLQFNEIHRNFKFNMKGIAIGNPALNMPADTASTYDFLWSHGLISDESYEGLSSSCLWDDYDQSVANNNESVSCNEYINQTSIEIGDSINPYDVILDVCVPGIVAQELRLQKMISHMSIGVDVCMSTERYYYLNQPEVQKALHANTTRLPYPWSNCNGPLQYDEHELTNDIVPVLKALLKRGLRIWIFSGDEDSVVPFLGTRMLVNKIAKDLKLSVTSAYKPWYLGDQVAGWSQAYTNLTFATVRGAAHMVPFSQPERALLLFKRFVSGQTLYRHNNEVI